MNTNTYSYELKFSLNKCVSERIKNTFKKIKHDCENGNNKYIVENLKEYFKLKTNKNLPYLNRTEGGLGGDNNIEHKQIRFRMNLLQNNNFLQYNDEDIVMTNICSSENQKWTIKELDDIIYAFIKFFYYKLGYNCVKGSIVMTNNKQSDDDYITDDE